MNSETIQRRVNGSFPMIAEIKFACAHCGQKIAVEPEAAGVSINCPTCQNRVTIPREGVAAEARRTEGGLREKLAALQSECERLRANATHSQAEIKSFQTERLALRNEAAALKQRAAGAEAQVAAMDVLRQRLKGTETQLASIECERLENQAALSHANAELAATAEELADQRSELAAAVGFAENARAGAAATLARLAETETGLAEALGKLNAAQAEVETLRAQFAATSGEVETLRRLMDRDETSRELLVVREKLTAADEELRTRRGSATQLESDLARTESERARLDDERIALHLSVAEAQMQAEELSGNRLIADNAKLRELLGRQNDELKQRFREITIFRRAKITLKIVWALAAIGAIVLGYFFVKVLPTLEWAP